jgi:hypothetical protein
MAGLTSRNIFRVHKLQMEDIAMHSITELKVNSRGHARPLGLSPTFFYSLEQWALFVVKTVLALSTVMLATLTAVAAEQYFYAAHPLSETNLLFMLQ